MFKKNVTLFEHVYKISDLTPVLQQNVPTFKIVQPLFIQRNL